MGLRLTPSQKSGGIACSPASPPTPGGYRDQEEARMDLFLIPLRTGEGEPFRSEGRADGPPILAAVPPATRSDMKDASAPPAGVRCPRGRQARLEPRGGRQAPLSGSGPASNAVRRKGCVSAAGGEAMSARAAGPLRAGGGDASEGSSPTSGRGGQTGPPFLATVPPAIRSDAKDASAPPAGFRCPPGRLAHFRPRGFVPPGAAGSRRAGGRGRHLPPFLRRYRQQRSQPQRMRLRRPRGFVPPGAAPPRQQKIGMGTWALVRGLQHGCGGLGFGGWPTCPCPFPTGLPRKDGICTRISGRCWRGRTRRRRF